MPRQPPESVFVPRTDPERDIDDPPGTSQEQPDVMIGEAYLISGIVSIDYYITDRPLIPDVQFTMRVGINVTIMEQVGSGNLHLSWTSQTTPSMSYTVCQFTNT